MVKGYHSAMRRGGNVLVVVAVSLLAACSGSDDSTASPTTKAPPATPPPTEVTTESPTTPPPTDPSPSTDAPTTTTDPATTLAAEVEADFLETFRLTDIAIQDPTSDEKVAAALEGYTGSNRDLIERQIDDLRANGYVARPNPDVNPAVIVEKPPVLASSPADTALIQVCQIDSWIVVDPGSGPDGADSIVNPDIVSYRSIFALSRIDGRWRIRGSESLGEFPGEQACPPE